MIGMCDFSLEYVSCRLVSFAFIKKFHGAAIVETFSMIVKQKTLAFWKNFRKIESTQILEVLWKR